MAKKTVGGGRGSGKAKGQPKHPMMPKPNMTPHKAGMATNMSKGNY